MDINTQLSPNYQVRDLIPTSTGIPNLPTDDYLPNLKALANVLELLSEIDSFDITSGFRSPAVNSAVGGADYSFHSDGLAADIVPHHISNQEFFYRIHNNPRYRNAVGEYIFYPLSHRSIHVSAPTPSKVAYDLKQTDSGYERSGIPFDDSWSMSLPAGAPMYLALALGLGLILFTVYRSRRVL